jgi:hypothetical protein
VSGRERIRVEGVERGLVGNHSQGTVTRFDLESTTVLKTFPAGKGVETLAYY